MPKLRAAFAAAAVTIIAIGALTFGAVSSGAGPFAHGTPHVTEVPSGRNPDGGISEQEAIRIAARYAGVGDEIVAVASASLDKGNRWVWRVQAIKGYGPTSCSGMMVTVDYWTGKVLEGGPVMC